MDPRRTLRRACVVSCAAALSIGVLGACSSDSDSSTTTTTAAADASGTTSTATATGVDATCSAWLDLDAAATKGPDSGDQQPTPAQLVSYATSLQPLAAKALDGAPDEVATPLGDLAKLIDDAAADNSGAAAQKLDPTNPALAAPLTKVESWVYDSCGFTQIDAKGMDYSFEGLPDTVPAGPVSIKFTNSSTDEEHELVALKINDGASVTADELAAALKKDTNAAEQKYGNDVTFTANTTAEAGKTAFTTAQLDAGEYVLACFIPQGGTDGGTPHAQLGMVSTFTVE